MIVSGNRPDAPQVGVSTKSNHMVVSTLDDLIPYMKLLA